jgi:hypothetical protein
MAAEPALSRVWVDLNNSDAKGNVRLNCIGTVDDLSRQGIVPREGLRLLLYCLELETEGVVCRSEEGIWAANVNWDKVRDRD